MKIVVITASAVLALATIGAAERNTVVPSQRLVAGNRLEIRDTYGSIRVTNGARFTIAVTKYPDRGDAASARVVTAAVPNGLLVCIRYRGEPDDCTDRGGTTRGHSDVPRVDLAIEVPRGVDVTAVTVSGAIDVRTDAKVSATSVDGSIDLDAADVDRATSVNGPIAVRVRGDSANPLRVTAVSGSVDVTLPAGAGASVRANTINGSIDAPGLSVSRPEFGPGASVSGELGRGGRRVDLNTINGSIHFARA